MLKIEEVKGHSIRHLMWSCPEAHDQQGRAYQGAKRRIHCHGAHEGSANEVILPATRRQHHTESFNDLQLTDTHTYTQTYTEAEACHIATITLV